MVKKINLQIINCKKWNKKLYSSLVGEKVKETLDKNFYLLCKLRRIKDCYRKNLNHPIKEKN